MAEEVAWDQCILSGLKLIEPYYDDFLHDVLGRVELKSRLCSRVSSGVRGSLKGNRSKPWEALVGYDIDQLKVRLETTMPEGYTWDDFVLGNLHVDHMIPVSVFNFEKPEDIDFKRCWALENLQLLPASENIRKGAKLDAPFQPSFIF